MCLLDNPLILSILPSSLVKILVIKKWSTVHNLFPTVQCFCPRPRVSRTSSVYKLILKSPELRDGRSPPQRDVCWWFCNVSPLVGEPITVPKHEEATPDVVDMYHTMYINSLTTLFNTHKTRFGLKESDVLLIHWRRRRRRKQKPPVFHIFHHTNTHCITKTWNHINNDLSCVPILSTSTSSAVPLPLGPDPSEHIFKNKSFFWR